MELPWKRNDGDVDVGVKQSEFPTWVENKEYTNYYSPTTTFLGKPILHFNHRMKWFYKDSYVLQVDWIGTLRTRQSLIFSRALLPMLSPAPPVRKLQHLSPSQFPYQRIRTNTMTKKSDGKNYKLTTTQVFNNGIFKIMIGIRSFI